MSGSHAVLAQEEDAFSAGEGVRPGDIEAAASKREGDERRGAERLAPERLADLAQEADEPEEEQQFFLPRHARGMAISLLVALGLAFAVSARMPAWPVGLPLHPPPLKGRIDGSPLRTVRPELVEGPHFL